jgi:hypothetical protein
MYNVKNWMLLAQDPLHNNGRLDFVPYTDEHDQKFLRPAMCTEGLSFIGILSFLRVNGVTYPFLYIHILWWMLIESLFHCSVAADWMSEAHCKDQDNPPKRTFGDLEVYEIAVSVVRHSPRHWPTHT